MNEILAKVTAIESCDNLSVLALHANGHNMRLMALGLNFPLKVGSEVLLGVKSSNISLATSIQAEISISNQLSCSIESLEMGALLCSVRLRFGNVLLRSVITKASALSMQLQERDPLIALIKASDLSIIKIIDETKR
ncbi:MAG: TOBE domain-containing protein [Sulfurimonas sp.]|jgi:molybdopterin-binding protein|nr:TOBE domain-containing protein [Sulfurimonas sp.]